MATAADIYLKDDSLATLPIASAIVSVYNASTMALVAQAVSDSNGKAAFSLPGSAGVGTTYEVRVFKLGVIFANPFWISVVEPVVTTNTFDISGTVLTLPVSVDPRVCRCTGRFTGFTNTPVPNVSFRVSAFTDSGTQAPKVLDGNMVSPDTTVFHSDEDGIVSVDLIRSGKYYVTFSGEEDVIWPITIPDRSSVNLIDLIHPAPVALNWDQNAAPGNIITVQVGQVVVVDYTVTMSDYSEVSIGRNVDKVIDIWNTTPDFMEVAAGDALIAVKGISPGSGQVSASVSPNLTPIRLPTPTLVCPLLNVTIVP